MNEETKLVADWLDKQATNSYVEKVGSFRVCVTEGLADCGSDDCSSSLIVIGLKDVDWDWLHKREFQRYKRDQIEAAKNRKEQEKLGDIPF